MDLMKDIQSSTLAEEIVEYAECAQRELVNLHEGEKLATQDTLEALSRLRELTDKLIEKVREEA